MRPRLDVSFAEAVKTALARDGEELVIGGQQARDRAVNLRAPGNSVTASLQREFDGEDLVFGSAIEAVTRLDEGGQLVGLDGAGLLDRPLRLLRLLALAVDRLGRLDLGGGQVEGPQRLAVGGVEHPVGQREPAGRRAKELAGFQLEADAAVEEEVVVRRDERAA